MKKIIVLVMLSLIGMSCQKKDCKHWTMVVEDTQMKLDEANLNYMHNPSEENLSKIKVIKQNLVLHKRNKQNYCD